MASPSIICYWNFSI